MIQLINAKKVNFSEKEIDVVQLGIDLTKRAMFSLEPNIYKKYASFSNAGGIDYLTHNKGFFDKVAECAYERTGMDATKTNINLAFSMQNFERAFFSVIEEVIDNVNSKNEIEEILTFADVRSMAEGDSMNIDVKPTNAYFFYKTGRGKSYGRTQKYYGKNVTLTPSPAETTISFNRKDIVAGRVDWGREIARAVRGIRSGYLQDVSTVLFDTASNPIGNKIIDTGAYNETQFRTNMQTMQARNGSSNSVIYGTNIALAPILPANSQLQLGLGAEYMEKGFLATPFGYRAIELPQALKADNATAIISNSYVIGMSLDVSKPISIGISGETRIKTLNNDQNASDDFIYTVMSDWDVKLAGQGTILLARTV
jgi:hypothetical protein